MKEWCLGFIISFDTDSVVLLKKSRAMHIGCWNGIGGKIEEHESAHQSMVRECNEEARLTIPKWEHVGYLRGGNDDPWRVFIYATAGAVSSDLLKSGSGIADYPYQVPLDKLNNFKLAPYTSALIQLSIDKLRNHKNNLIHLEEVSI